MGSLRGALNATWVRVWIGFLLGFAMAVAVVGRPEWGKALWSAEGAGWGAALGTAFASLVALWLGLESSRRETDRERARSTAAASVFSRSFSRAMSLVDAIGLYGEVYQRADVLGANAPRYRDELLRLELFLPDTFHALLTELPPSAARLISVADMEQRRMRGVLEAIAPDSDGWTVAEAVIESGASLRRIVHPTADELYRLMYGDKSVAPWNLPVNRQAAEEAPAEEAVPMI